jgi:hypothetical protein
VQAAAYGKQVLDRLRGNISWNSWEDQEMREADNPHVLAADPNFPGYSASYNILDDTLDGGKQINLTITW